MEKDQDPTSPAAGFTALGLSAPLVQTLADIGYETPTAIQQQTINCATIWGNKENPRQA